jgi:hypothetical protein
MLKRPTLPVGQEGTPFDRLKALPHVEIRFVEPGTEEWWEPWTH